MWFFRLSYLFLSCVAVSAYELSRTLSDSPLFSIAKGCVVSLLLFLALWGAERLIRKACQNARRDALRKLGVGLVCGAFLALLSTFFVKALFSLSVTSEWDYFQTPLFLLAFLAPLYYGVVVVASAENGPLFPFLAQSQSKKREILVDLSAIEDARLLELARTGIVDDQLVIAEFIMDEIQKGSESHDEMVRTKYRKCAEHIKRLESFPNLKMRVKAFTDLEGGDPANRLARAAAASHVPVLTSDAPARYEEWGLIVISLEILANALKPAAQKGEALLIKIARLGKEPKQGVGYLDDGTMVVVNGGGEYLGHTIRTQVLSQKYSSSGKIIFCNALDRPMSVAPEGASSPYHCTAN